MSLENVRVILVQPSHAGNIGATARAMANMGLSQLALVEPRDFPSEEANARAAGADRILTNATCCVTLDEALAGTVLVVGTTARRRSVAWPSLDPRSAMQQACAESRKGDVALVFGRERSGLTNQELDRCHLLVRIPVDESFPSLNLASAVTVLAYELRSAALATDDESRGTAESAVQQVVDMPPDSLASSEQVRGFYQHLERVLREIDFLKHPSDKLTRKIVRLFSRTRMTEDEVNIFRGILSAVERQSKGNQ